MSLFSTTDIPPFSPVATILMLYVNIAFMALLSTCTLYYLRKHLFRISISFKQITWIMLEKQYKKMH